MHVPRRRRGARPERTSTKRVVASAAVTYLEGYLWDEPAAKDAIRRAAAIAHRAGRRVALTLSDPFCVERHRAEFLELVEGDIDILFANEDEITMLYEVDDFDEARTACAAHCEIAALTRGAHGLGRSSAATSVHVIDAPIRSTVVDTTGAGDLYAAGFLYGLTHGHDLATCGRLGSLARGRGDLAPRCPPGSRARRAGAARARSLTGGGATPPVPHRRSRARSATSPSSSRSSATSHDADLVFELIVSAVRLARDRASRGDLKIANAALKEMRYAFTVFEPYRVGAQGRDLRLGAHDAATIRSTSRPSRSRASSPTPTGWSSPAPGPGIMEAGIEGAGAANSLRREHPAAVRGRDHAVPRRRSEARQLPLLLHAQGHVREGGARVRAAARRLRHARRGASSC